MGASLFFTAAMIRAFLGKDHCSSEEIRWTHVDPCVWQELEYRIGVCRITRSGHVEHV
jgi:hypothetical protein